ncbi:MAG TPA: chromate resistance protein ChrB domain-containing protein [Pyrinomonadaceae bacterium]|nr:chromate resistance protein ChrB domain-containing protein [Pyrinomonadaceae bacterium]
MKSEEKQEWIMLVHQLPQKPTKLRVRSWRKLQALGALAIKNSVYVLPYNEKTNEDFAWLRQEIETSGGEANLFRASSVEGQTDKEIIGLFRQERNEDYTKLISEFEGLAGATREQTKGNSLSVGKLTQYIAELSKLRQELERVIAIDFFKASQGKKARCAFEKCRRQLQTTENKNRKEPTAMAQGGSARLETTDYQNRRWATRRDPHIDRLATAWLIRRFIDKRPRFYFVSEGEPIENTLTFDMPGGDFTHRGEDCTFETMIKLFHLESDNALCQIAEIVHDIDLKDNKFNRPEAFGVNVVIRGLAAVYADDSERLRQSRPVFDGLYELFARDTNNEPRTKNTSVRKKQGGK